MQRPGSVGKNKKKRGAAPSLGCAAPERESMQKSIQPVRRVFLAAVHGRNWGAGACCPRAAPAAAAAPSSTERRLRGAPRRPLLIQFCRGVLGRKHC